MAHLWRSSGAGDWQALTVDGASFMLDASTLPIRTSDAEIRRTGESAVLLRRVAHGNDDIWVLLASAAAGVSVNGLSLDLGIVVLHDRDEVRCSATPAPCFFSTERLACATAYPAAARGFCPRCKDAIPAGEIAVRCPGCGLWHHATEERPCWTYGEQCAACPQPTAPDAGFRWTPEEL